MKGYLAKKKQRLEYWENTVVYLVQGYHTNYELLDINKVIKSAKIFNFEKDWAFEIVRVIKEWQGWESKNISEEYMKRSCVLQENSKIWAIKPL